MSGKWMNALLSTIVAGALVAWAAPCWAQPFSFIQPLDSFAGVPSLARTSADVRARFGEVTGPDGKVNGGDIQAAQLFRLIKEWIKLLKAPSSAEAMGMVRQEMNGGVNPAATQLVGRLQKALPELANGRQQIMKSFGQTQSKLEPQYQDDVSRIAALHHTRLEQGGCLGSGPKKVDCAAVRREQDVATLKAGDAYLTNLMAPYADMAAKMKALATRTQGFLDEAHKTFGDTEPYTAPEIMSRLARQGVDALASVASTESEAVALVHKTSILPTEHK